MFLIEAHGHMSQDHLLPVICLSVVYSHELLHILIISLRITLLTEIVFGVFCG